HGPASAPPPPAARALPTRAPRTPTPGSPLWAEKAMSEEAPEEQESVPLAQASLQQLNVVKQQLEQDFFGHQGSGEQLRRPPRGPVPLHLLHGDAEVPRAREQGQVSPCSCRSPRRYTLTGR
ncbi:unnamed protein product, partial [Prorocentrum cordatum]